MSVAQQSQRFKFIDLLRGWAVFVMIETHIVNALLRSDIKDLASFKILTFLNGLVAPSFLLCAGLGSAISLNRKWDEYIFLKKSMWKYVLRILFILIIGYSLHLPFFSLKRLISITDVNIWLPFFQVDILQLIAISLLITLIIAMLSRGKSNFLYIIAFITVLIVFISPNIREMDFTSVAVWLRPYFTTEFKSQFPIFPWSSFLMSGCIIGFLYLKVVGSENEKKFMNYLIVISLIGILTSLIIEIIPVKIYPKHDFWKASPQFFFIRLGLVLVALAIMWFYLRNHEINSNSLFIIFGQESLLVYTVHLLIIYGYTYKWSFIRYFGPNLNYLECLGLFVLLTLAMYILVYIWHEIKVLNMKIAKKIQYATLTIIGLTFLLRCS